MPSDKTIRSTGDDMAQVRQRICDMVNIASAIFVVPAVSASVYRSLENGWRGLMIYHIAAAAILWGLLIFRKSVPYNLRAGTIVGLFLVTGLTGFWEFGIVAGANPMLLVAPVLATILFGRRVGIWFTAAMVAVMLATAYSFLFGGRVFTIDFNINGGYVPSWIAYVLAVILCVATPIAAISMSNRHLREALNSARQGRDQLASLNAELEVRIEARTRELEDAKKAAEEQARTDMLTGLNNRRAFFEYLDVVDAHSRRYNHTYVVAMIDIDHFKAVNDTWGHDVGDAALKAIGRIIAQTFRETDITGRFGGEEFVAVLPETMLKDAVSLAERLRETVEETVIATSKEPIRLTVSIGLAALEGSDQALEQIIAEADAALYRAKKAGRNRVDHVGRTASGAATASDTPELLN